MSCFIKFFRKNKKKEISMCEMKMRGFDWLFRKKGNSGYGICAFKDVSFC